jgi:thiopeptide-type bacteriocin biosynthesis protein
MTRSELYLCAHAAPENHGTVVSEFVLPLALSIRDRPELHSLFFVRMNVPTWQVRFRVVGEEGWLHGPYRREAEERLQPFLDDGRITEVEWTRYQREVERYGGEEGMDLAEKIYLHDSLACLEWLALERAGKLTRSRREIALLMGERYADLLGLEGTERARFYHFAYRWALAMGTWDEGDLDKLEHRYRELAPGLREMLEGELAREPEALWGGTESAAIAERLLRALEPLLTRVAEDCRAGRIRQQLAYLGWSYTHLPCNRLGLPPAPEAILRYLQHRFHQERHGLPGPDEFPVEPLPPDEPGAAGVEPPTTPPGSMS